jgi:DNA-binding transcriptional LysR family regulator
MPRTDTEEQEVGSPTEGASGSIPVALSRLRVRHLQLLDALHRLGSLRQVGLELGIGQPQTLSLIEDLEFAFGTPLVVRDHSGTSLTPTAHAVLEHARVALHEITAARDIAQRNGRSGGRIRVGASPYLIAVLVPTMVERLHQALPSVELDIREGTLDALVGELTDGQLDVVLGSVDRATVLSSRIALEATFLFAEEMAVVAGKGHPLFGRMEATLAEVLPGPWVLPHASSHVRGLFDTAVLETEHTPVAPRIECRGILNLLAIASQAGLLTVAPRAELGKPAWSGLIHELPGGLRMRAPPYVLVMRRYSQPPHQLAELRRVTVAAAQTLFGSGTFR